MDFVLCWDLGGEYEGANRDVSRECVSSVATNGEDGDTLSARSSTIDLIGKFLSLGLPGRVGGGGGRIAFGLSRSSLVTVTGRKRFAMRTRCPLRADMVD
jgi:hypothetical protein